MATCIQISIRTDCVLPDFTVEDWYDTSITFGANSTQRQEVAPTGCHSA